MERAALVAAAASGAEAEDWDRRRLVAGREVASCRPLGDDGRSADGEVMRRRVGTLGAELDVGAETRRRPVAGVAEAGEPVDEDAGAGAGGEVGAGGYW